MFRTSIRMQVAHIQGRFQPFHREHADYARWAAEDNDKLIIGITRPDPSATSKEEADPKRHLRKHNPLFYFERKRIIRSFVESENWGCRVELLPFPITKPELWDHYAPQDVTHYVNILEPWHKVKVERFKDAGRKVEFKHGERGVSSTDIRERIARGDPWEHEVPDSVAEAMKDMGVPTRIRELWSGL